MLAFADERQITVADLNTDEVLSLDLIEPNKTYWRKPKQTARPLAELPELRPMTRFM